MNNTTNHTEEVNTDIEKNKSWAMLSYIIFLIPLLAAPRDSRFVKYHVNQGLILAIASISISIVIGIISSIFTGLFGFLIPYSALILGSIFALIWFVACAIMVTFMIKGVVTAAKGEMKPLPIIGRFNILT